MSDDAMGGNVKGLRRGLAHYGDAGFSLFLRKAFIKAMG
jgi:dihydroxy-acid dehydratase